MRERCVIRDWELIAEAVLVARAQDTNPRTIAKYELHHGHFANYLASARRQSLLTARRKDVPMFLAHLCEPGGGRPHRARRVCAWCAQRGFPTPSFPDAAWRACARREVPAPGVDRPEQGGRVAPFRPRNRRRERSRAVGRCRGQIPRVLGLRRALAGRVGGPDVVGRQVQEHL